jgi:hypothetical protein
MGLFPPRAHFDCCLLNLLDERTNISLNANFSSAFDRANHFSLYQLTTISEAMSSMSSPDFECIGGEGSQPSDSASGKGAPLLGCIDSEHKEIGTLLDLLNLAGSTTRIPKQI